MQADSKLIFGTGLSSSKEYEDLLPVIRMAVKNGIRRFDTAPSYRTEKVLNQTLQRVMAEYDLPREIFHIQTKIDAWQMQASEGNVNIYVEKALKEMKQNYLDSLLIHWPIPEYLDATWECMVRLQEKGLVKKIGVCNVRLRQLRKFVEWNVKPQMIQIERNPLQTCAAEIAFCQENGIEVQAYSPLCKMDERIRDNELLKTIAERYQKSVGQIVLRWHLDTKVVPVFTSKKPERVQEYTDINDFCLTEEELMDIASLNENYKRYLESWGCPGF